MDFHDKSRALSRSSSTRLLSAAQKTSRLRLIRGPPWRWLVARLIRDASDAAEVVERLERGFTVEEISAETRLTQDRVRKLAHVVWPLDGVDRHHQAVLARLRRVIRQAEKQGVDVSAPMEDLQ